MRKTSNQTKDGAKGPRKNKRVLSARKALASMLSKDEVTAEVEYFSDEEIIKRVVKMAGHDGPLHLLPMLELLNSFDAVKEDQRVGQLQATRVYRQLLQMHRQGAQSSALSTVRSEKLFQDQKEAQQPKKLHKFGSESDRPRQNYLNLDDLEAQFEKLVEREKIKKLNKAKKRQEAETAKVIDSQKTSSANHEFHSNATQSFDEFKLKADVLSLEESASGLDLSEDDEAVKAHGPIKIQNQEPSKTERQAKPPVPRLNVRPKYQPLRSYAKHTTTSSDSFKRPLNQDLKQALPPSRSVQVLDSVPTPMMPPTPQIAPPKALFESKPLMHARSMSGYSQLTTDRMPDSCHQLEQAQMNLESIQTEKDKQQRYDDQLRSYKQDLSTLDEEIKREEFELAEDQIKRQTDEQEAIMLQRLDELAWEFRQVQIRMNGFKHFKRAVNKSRTERMKEHRAIAHFQRSLMIRALQQLRVFIFLVVPENKAISAAQGFEKNQIKIKVFKALVSNMFSRRELASQINDMQNRRNRFKMQQILQELEFYQKKRLLKQVQYEHSRDYWRKRTLDKVFITMRVLAVKNVNGKLLRGKADDFHALNTLKTAFNSMILYYDRSKTLKTLEVKAKNHRQHSSIVQMRNIFVALQKWKEKQQTDRTANGFYNANLLKKSFEQLVSGVKISQESRLLKQTASQLYENTLKRKIMNQLIQNNSQSHFIDQQVALLRCKRLMVFTLTGLSLNRNSRYIPYTLNASQIWLLHLWLSQSMHGRIQRTLWITNPCYLAQEPKPLIFENFFQVNKKKQLFLQTNKTLAKDLMVKAFFAMKNNYTKLKVFVYRNRLKKMQYLWRAWNKVKQGDKLMEKFIARSQKVRDVQAQKEVFNSLKDWWYTKKVEKGKMLAVMLKTRGRMVSEMFVSWQILYLERAKDQAQFQKADQFYQEKTFQKFMSLWVAKYNKKIYKRNIVAIQPLVHRQIRQKFFTKWMLMLSKQNYMQQQLQTLRSINETKLMNSAFASLKQHLLNRRAKNVVLQFCSQHYMHSLGVRIFKALIENRNEQQIKRELVIKVRGSYELKLEYRVIERLKRYSHRRKWQRVMDARKTQMVHSLVTKGLFQKWQSFGFKVKCLKFMVAILDDALMRKGLRHIKGHLQDQDKTVISFSYRREYLRKKQFLYAWKQYHRKRISNYNKGSELYSNSKNEAIYRCLNQWKSAMRLRQRHYHAFNLNILAIAHTTKAKYFRLLKKSARYHVLKRSCQTVHEMGMKKRVLENWRSTSQKHQRQKLMGKLILSERSQKTLIFSMKFWMFRTKQKQLLRQRQVNQERNKLRKYFEVIWVYKDKRIQERQFMREARYCLQLQKVKRRFSAWREQLDKSRLRQEMAKVAFEVWEEKRIKKILAHWQVIVQNKKHLRQKSIEVEDKVNARLICKLFFTWQSKSQKSLRILQAVSKLDQLDIKATLSKSLQRIDQESLRIQDLEQEAQIHHVNHLNKLQEKSISALRLNILFQMKKREQVLECSNVLSHNSLGRIFSEWRNYVETRKAKQQMILVAETHYEATLQRRAIDGLFNENLKRRKLQMASRLFKESQQRRFGKFVLWNLQNLVDSRRCDRLNQEKANLVLNYNLCNKAFTAWLSRVGASKYKQIARAHYENRLKNQIFDALRLSAPEQANLKINRRVMEQLIQTIDSQNLMTKTFNALKQFPQSVKEDVTLGNKRLTILKVANSFYALQMYAQNQQNLRQIEIKNIFKQKQNHWTIWRQTFVRAKIEKGIQVCRLERILKSSFEAIKSKWQLKQTAQKFEALKRLRSIEVLWQQLVQHKIQSKLMQEKNKMAKQQLIFKLKQKVMASLAYHHDLCVKKDQVSIIANKRLANSSMKIWFDKTVKRNLIKENLRNVLFNVHNEQTKEAFKTFKRQVALRTFISRTKEIIGLKNSQSDMEKYLIAITFESFKRNSKSKLLANALTKNFRRVEAASFEQIKMFSTKEKELRNLETSLKSEVHFELKQKVLFEWVRIMNQSQILTKIMAKNDTNLKFKVLEAFKVNQIRKQEKNSLLNRLRPALFEKTHIRKAFLILCHENSHVPNEPLMRHVFDSWRLAMNSLRDEKFQETRALAFNIIKSQSKGFEALRSYRQRKLQQDEQKQLAETWCQKNQIHKAFGILKDYREKRAGIKALNEIGGEMRVIRESQTAERVLMAWYEAMCLGVKNGSRMDKVVESYAQVVNQRRLENVFGGWKQALMDIKQQHLLKEELVEVSLQLKKKSLLADAFEAIKQEHK